MARKVNEELNLTPFIDLFSMLVVFLLLTAVWNQVSSLTTNIESSTSSDSPPPEEKEISLGITIYQDRIQLLEDNKPINISNTDEGELNERELLYYLREWKKRYPDKESITLNTQNNTAYGKMIRVFDTLVGEGYPEVGVNPQ